MGTDWWNTDPASKHLVASQAKALYREYWDDYFKFAIVRNPYTRVKSCLKYEKFFGMRQMTNGGLRFHNYHRKFGEKVVLEGDHRFYEIPELVRERHKEGQVYLNLLDEELDFVAKFECFNEDMDFVRDRLSLPTSFQSVKHRLQASKAGDFAGFDQVTLEKIRQLYRNDFVEYGYDINDSSVVETRG